MPDDQTATQELATLRAALKGLEEELRNSAAYYMDDHGDDDTSGRDKARGETQLAVADRLAALREGRHEHDEEHDQARVDDSGNAEASATAPTDK